MLYPVSHLELNTILVDMLHTPSLFAILGIYFASTSYYSLEICPLSLAYDRLFIIHTRYHLCNSDELKIGQPIEIRALNHVFVLWRTEDGLPVVQDAFCLHLGANLAVGGNVIDNCIECPFHHWKFDREGNIKDIPYLRDSKHSLPTKKLKTYPSRDWCGLLCVYFHADDAQPEFELPAFIQESIDEERWAPHLQWNIGFKTLSPVDWVDQAGDHAHFHTLHAEFLIPWTTIPIPKWILNFFPLGICHKLTTHRGDDSVWKEIIANRAPRTKGHLTPEAESGGQYCSDKHLVFFEDVAGLTWNGKPIESTKAKTLETYIGPAMMCFHIPFTIGAIKAFVTTTPVEGGSVMRVKTFIDYRVRFSLWKRLIAWIVTGISASQLISDIDIMCNKIRRDKPLLVPFDGPYNRMNAWLKLFYSEGSDAANDLCKYNNEW